MNVTSNANQTGNNVLAQLTSSYEGVLDVPLVVESILYGETGIALESLSKRISERQAKTAGLEMLTTALKGFSSIMSSISDDFAGLSKNVLMSDPTLGSVKVSDSVANGNYSLEVLSLASKQSLTVGGFSSSTQFVGEGKLVFQSGDMTSGTLQSSSGTIEIDVTPTMNVRDLVDAVNSSSAPVTAYLVNTSSGVEVAFASKNTGASNGFSVSVVADPASSLNSFSYDDTVKNASIKQQATDSSVLLDGVFITSSTNNFDNVIEGFEFSVNKINAGSPSTFTIQDDIAKSKTALSDFIENYNYAREIFTYLSSAEPGEDSKGVLYRDPDLRMLQRNFDTVVEQYVAGYGGNGALSSLGVKFKNDKSGMLELDESIFNTAITADPYAVKNALGQNGITTDPGIKFISAGENSVAREYSPVSITVMAETAKISGASSGLFEVDATNSSFSLSVNGQSTGNIDLPIGVYADGAALAQAMQSSIASQLNDSSVTVSYVAGQYVIDSGVFGSGSSVRLDTASAGFETLTGLTVGLEDAGVDVVGNVGGNLAIGVGNLLEVITGDGVGIKLEVNVPAIGSYGSFTLNDGAAKSYSKQIDGLFTSQGLFTSIMDKYELQSDRSEKQKSALELRTEELRVRYSQQYAMINSAIIQFSQIGKQLQAQFDSWNKA